MVLTRIILGMFACNTVILYHYTLLNNNDYTRYNIHSAWFWILEYQLVRVEIFVALLTNSMHSFYSI